MDYKEKQEKIVKNLKKKGIKSIAIISVPDYAGGREEVFVFSKNEDEDWWEDLDSFSYVEWNGTPDDLPIVDPVLTSHVEPFHEEPRDYEWNWEDSEEFNDYLN